MQKKLRAENARLFAGDGVTSALTNSASDLTLWWLTGPKSRAYPAIACVQKKATAGQGFELKPAEAYCGGASSPECNRLRRAIHRAKF
ncbi:hypothetical protein [Phenylobacterium soli]|uniref:hypothetical protein n=1 Tax=Phenylobacterium soli TaxID=2170551 RepID=UPI0010578736